MTSPNLQQNVADLIHCRWVFRPTVNNVACVPSSCVRPEVFLVALCASRVEGATTINVAVNHACVLNHNSSDR